LFPWLWRIGRWHEDEWWDLWEARAECYTKCRTSVGRLEVELQWKADVCRVWGSKQLEFSTCQVLWKIVGRSASCMAVCRTSSLVCATDPRDNKEWQDDGQWMLPPTLSKRCARAYRVQLNEKT
jgi:hypothetical protein